MIKTFRRPVCHYGVFPENRDAAVAVMTVLLTEEDAAAVRFAYTFVVGRLGELVALETAAEALRARHRDLDKHAAEEAAYALIEQMKTDD